MPLLRRSDQAQRQDLIGVPAVEVHGLWRVDDGEVRRHGDKAGRVPRVAPLQGLPSGDAGRRAVLQAQDGRVLGGLAHVRPRRRAPPRALRRRYLGRARPRRAHMLQRREGGLLVHGKVGELEGVVGPHGADPGARGGRHRRRERVRQGRARDLAAHQGPEVHLPRLLAGQALHDDAAEATGGARALPHRARPHGHRDAAPGGALGRALPRLVRVLGRLPGGQDRGGRQEGLHPREAEAGALVAVVAGVGGDAVHLPRPRPCQGRPAAVDQQHDRGRGELAAEGRPAQPPGADVGQAREGGVLVVPRSFGGREDGVREARHDADRRGHRLPVQRLLCLAVARGRRAGVGRQGRVGGPPPQGPVPVLAGLMDGNGCSIGTHILSYKPLFHAEIRKAAG